MEKGAQNQMEVEGGKFMSVKPNTSDAPRSPETPRDTGAASTTTLIVTRRVALQVTLGAFAALAGTGVLEVGSRTHTGAAARGHEKNTRSELSA